MNLKFPTFTLEEFKNHLLQNRSVIDVRAPIEFETGSIPGSVNLPILDNEERALIGTCYKKEGQQKAIELGYQIVSGENKKRKQEGWSDFLKKNPDAILTCYRGGLRSQITQEFISETGILVPRLEKGYKQARGFFTSQVQDFCETRSLILLTGLTGSAKTHLLGKASDFYPMIDLEKMAQHRGSAFGEMPLPQPSQADFENRLSVGLLLANDSRPLLCEDESRLIGKRYLPENFFLKLRRSKVIIVHQSLEERIENILQDYVVTANPTVNLFLSFENSLKKLEKRLGGLRTKEILEDLRHSRIEFVDHRELKSNRVWIEKLLVQYYDKLYLSSFEKRNPEVLFQGNHSEILGFLSTFR